MQAPRRGCAKLDDSSETRRMVPSACLVTLDGYAGKTHKMSMAGRRAEPETT
jgi:hypothetical protein